MANQKLLLDTNIVMCSGVNCERRDECFRSALNTFFNFIAREPHPNPRFMDSRPDCPFFIRTQYQHREESEE